MTERDGIGISDDDRAVVLEVAGGLKARGLELSAANDQWQHAAAKINLPVAEDDDDRQDVIDHAASILLERAAILASVALAEPANEINIQTLVDKSGECTHA